MTTQDLMDSAKLCGKFPYVFDDVVFVPLVVEGEEAALDWNPPTNPAQDREIRDALRGLGWWIHYAPATMIPHGHRHRIWRIQDGQDVQHYFDCDSDDFLTKAGAHVWREAKEGE